MLKFRATLFLAVLTALSVPIGSATQEGLRGQDASSVMRPKVRIVSPPETGFVLGSNSDTKILVVLEIVDVSGAGIVSNDRGIPRFYEANDNVEVFLDYLEARGTYTNGDGRTVVQLVSKLPVDHLKTGEWMITPPLDHKAIPKKLEGKGLGVPNEALLPSADFDFVVKDRQGANSEPATLAIALAADLFRGPYMDMVQPSKEGKEDDVNPPDAEDPPTEQR